LKQFHGPSLPNHPASASREKAPSTNIQAPENFQIPNFKSTRSFDFCTLELPWMLALGIWSFFLGVLQL
jgi:hypothetical protein